MDTQIYQPLSAALHPPQQQPNRSQQHPGYQYPPGHAQPSAASNGIHHNNREEEEEEEDEDEDIVEEELEQHNRDHQSPSTHSSPRVAAAHAAKSIGPHLVGTSTQYNLQVAASSHDANQDGGDDSKRKPGRPRGSRNRKPRAPANSSTKAPANSQHPGFYQYPPAPAGAVAQNQQFYEFQWRALNLCSEFYNAAEELIKAASPIVISQCYHTGPATKVDPLGLIAEAKRVCDNLLANPSHLVGQPPPPPTYPSMSSYGTMPPPPPPGAAPPSTTPGATGPVISNPQSFVMPLGAPPPPGYPPQSYYSTPYTAAPGGRYPTAPYYPYAAQPPAQYYPAPTPAPTSAPPPVSSASATPAPAPAPAAPVASTSSAPPVPGASLSAFSATTGNAAPGGTQGAWSEEETDRLRRLADQSRDMGGAQSKGEIEWDWVVQQWGNTRTRHQILLKATSLGLKESTTRGTKRRRGDDGGATESNANTSASVPTSNVTTVTPVTTFVSAPPTATSAIAPSPGQSSATSNPPSANASPATQPQRPPSTTVIAPARTTSGTTSGMPWPMPTVAANTPSPVMAHTQVDNRTAAYYRPRPGQQQQQQQQQQQAQYGAGPVANTVPSPVSARPPSSHGQSSATHPYMYRPNGSAASGRNQNSL